MELVEGPTLADRIKQGPIPISLARHSVDFVGSWARLNCESMSVIPARLVRSNLNDPCTIPYLLVWKMNATANSKNLFDWRTSSRAGENNEYECESFRLLFYLTRFYLTCISAGRLGSLTTLQIECFMTRYVGAYNFIVRKP
jgi:hypothetical protein